MHRVTSENYFEKFDLFCVDREKGKENMMCILKIIFNIPICQKISLELKKNNFFPKRYMKYINKARMESYAKLESFQNYFKKTLKIIVPFKIIL